MERDGILKLYRDKDSIEKVFLSFKNDLNEKRNASLEESDNRKGFDPLRAGL